MIFVWYATIIFGGVYLLVGVVQLLVRQQYVGAAIVFAIGAWIMDRGVRHLNVHRRRREELSRRERERRATAALVEKLKVSGR